MKMRRIASTADKLHAFELEPGHGKTARAAREPREIPWFWSWWHQIFPSPSGSESWTRASAKGQRVWVARWPRERRRVRVS